jgi:hypothetical protein
MIEDKKPTQKKEDLTEPAETGSIELVEEETERIAGGLKLVGKV